MKNLQPKPVKVFTREQPVTKVELYNCFYQGGPARPRAVVEARGEIGINAIKYMKKKGLAVEQEVDGVDAWALTAAGRIWLTEGLDRHLELHPEDKKLVMRATATRKRRTR